MLCIFKTERIREKPPPLDCNHAREIETKEMFYTSIVLVSLLKAQINDLP